MILISIAIAAGVVFLIVLLGILWTLFSRRESNTLDYTAYEDDDDSTHQRPSSLLEHINAATRTAIIGGASSPFDDTKNEKAAEGAALGGALGGAALGERDVFAQDGDNFVRAETPSDALHGPAQGRIARARYSFDGKAEGELPLSEGASLEILDDGDQKYVYRLSYLSFSLRCSLAVGGMHGMSTLAKKVWYQRHTSFSVSFRCTIRFLMLMIENVTLSLFCSSLDPHVAALAFDLDYPAPSYSPCIIFSNGW